VKKQQDIGQRGIMSFIIGNHHKKLLELSNKTTS